MMKKILFSLTCATVLAVGMGSCSKDDTPENGGDGNNFGGGGSGNMEQMTPEQSKEFLSDTAIEAMNLLNPEDQKELIDLCAYFGETYGDLELPPNFYMEEDYDNYLLSYFKAMGTALAKGDYNTLTRASVDYVYDIDFSQFKGVYEPGSYEWIRTGDSNDVVFLFKNKLGQQVEFKATGSSNSYNTSVEWTEEDWYYGDETTRLNFKVPAEVNVTLKSGSNLMADVKILSNVSFENHQFNVEVNGKVANIGVTAKTAGTDSQVTETSAITVSGNQFITSNATLNGNNLCNISFYQQYADDEEILATVLKNGAATVGVLGKVYIDATAQYAPGLFEGYDDYDEEETKAYVNLLTKCVQGQVRYNNTTTQQAKLGWYYTKDTYNWGYGSETYYEIQPVLIFPDGSPYFFEGYFNGDFGGVESAFESLIRKYQAIIDAAY